MSDTITPCENPIETDGPMAFEPLSRGISLSDYCQGVIDGRYDIKQPVRKHVEVGKFADAATWADQLLSEWHPTRNGDLTPQHVTARSHKKVWWQCTLGHDWDAAISNRSIGNGCPVCAGRKVLAGFNDLATKHPDLAAEWHPTRNGELTPQHVATSANKKVWWQCAHGHEWEATISSRSDGHGCPVCVGRKVLAGFNDLATKHPDLAAQWHPTRNGDLTPQHVAAGSDKKVWWQCAHGHEWEAVISSRSNGRGCPVCSGRKVLAGFNDLTTNNPDLAAQWHPTRNGDLTPQHVTAGSHKTVWWLGACGHDWEATINNRSNGNGCPVCAGRKVRAGFNDLTTNNPDLAAEWHPTLNGDLTSQHVTARSAKKVWWQCVHGHEWEATISNRSQGSGCPVCRVERSRHQTPGSGSPVASDPGR